MVGSSFPDTSFFFDRQRPTRYRPALVGDGLNGGEIVIVEDAASAASERQPRKIANQHVRYNDGTAQAEGQNLLFKRLLRQHHVGWRGSHIPQVIQDRPSAACRDDSD